MSGVAAEGVVAAGLALVSALGVLPGVLPACGVAVCAGCVPTALGFVVPVPSCEFEPVGLVGSAGVWLVTGVFAMEPLSGDWPGELEGELLLWAPVSVEPGCCSIAIRCG